MLPLQIFDTSSKRSNFLRLSTLTSTPSLNNLFFNKKISYDYKEYKEHLKLTDEYVKKTKKYKLNYK